MPGLKLFTSNRLEILVDKLAAEIRHHPLPVFDDEVIVVQSNGMQHWLNLEIAERNRISANTSFPFPKAFVYSLFRSLGEIADEDRYSPDIMTWRILDLLPALLKDSEFESLKRYCDGSRQELKRYQLSERIGFLFDNYLIHRPDLINKWDTGQNPLADRYQDSRWQFLLWRALTESERSEGRLTHAAELRRQFLNGRDLLLDLPQRVSVFGISSLPPFYLDVLKKLSEQIPVYFYYLNPCRHFWEYCYSAKETSNLLKDGITEENQYFEQGNPLLASMGVAGREFFSLVLNALEDTGEQEFVEPGADSLLTCIQADILNLIDRDEETPVIVNSVDRSLQIHSCHSPIREVEVLYDNLLSLFDENADLNPRDVAVMMPDVSTYAPLIKAVFDGYESEKTVIPYSIADVALNRTNAIAETFLSILAVNNKRFKAPEVIDILESQAIREQFEFSEEEVNLIKTWVVRSGIRWGVDEKHKEKLGLPPFKENTWQFGLNRLLLGIALPEREDLKLFSGILPYDDMEGDEVIILGRFARFFERLTEVSACLTEPKTLAEWSDFLNGVLSDFFASNAQTENQIQEVREALLENGLLGLSQASGFQKPVPLDVVFSYLNQRLTKDLRSSGFISKGVTFCTLLPMRSIPFKTIYILGMNDGEFPRTFRRTGFDLTRKEKRLCDRSKRDEDNYLFLESLLSARNHLLISYIGQSVTDNSERPPSVLVAELCNVLAKGFVTENGSSVLDQVITRHPLQSFSLSYFTKERSFFSYSTQNLEAAKANRKHDKQERFFFQDSIPRPVGESHSDVSLDHFCRFFLNPSEFILRNRLNINLRSDGVLQAEDREPFELDHLKRYRLKEDLIDYRLNHRDDMTFFEALKAQGELSHGTPGKMAFDRLLLETDSMLKGLSHLGIIDNQVPYPVFFSSENHPYRIAGVLRNLSSKGQLFFRPAKTRARDRLISWIFHLMLCQTSHGELSRETFYLGSDKVLHLASLENTRAREKLDDLMKLFSDGLTRPLPFFPQTSFAFAQFFLQKSNGNEQGACHAAEKIWNSGPRYSGEMENDAFKRCFGNQFPWSEAFKQTAITIFEPIFQYSKETTLDEFLQTA